MQRPRSTRARRSLGVAAIVATLTAVVVVVSWPHDDPPAPPPVAAAGSVAVRPLAVRPTPAPTSAVVTPPHDPVAAAGPTRFRFSAPGVTIDAHVCAMANERPLDPPGEQHHTVCWVRGGFGEAPGSDSATTYVLGHSWAPDPLEVLNRLSAPATRELLAARPVRVNGVATFPVHRFDGATLTLWTPRGRLDYRVHDAYGVDKYDLASVRRTMDEHVRNRIVLITCAERAGTDYPDNVVLEAYLSSSRAA